MKKFLGCLAISFAFLLTKTLVAGVIIPAGLNPGDEYHLVFVTGAKDDPDDPDDPDGTTVATSPEISYYNKFVTDQAALVSNLGADIGVSWSAIASTESTRAYDNAWVEAPVYRLDGLQVATGRDDFWDGELTNSILINQFGKEQYSEQWTGSLSTGEAHEGLELGRSGQSGYGSPFATLGSSHQTNELWIAFEDFNNTSAYSMYALSQKLTVPSVGTVPEPTSALSFVCLAAIAVFRRRRGVQG